VPSLPPLASGIPRPAVSVIVAARDEAARVETTVRRLLAQTEVDLEVVAVDDRSGDSTGAILDRLATEHRALGVVHVRELPEGWVGKLHALDRGARASRHPWLLFTDADTWLAPDVVARSVAAAVARSADHVALLPGQRTLRGPLGAATMMAAATGIAPMAARANRGTGHVGVGAFNLVRREALEGIGGWEALRLEVIDDLELGRRLHDRGFRTLAMAAEHDVDVDFADSPAALVRAFEKNGFAAFGYSVAVTVAVSLAIVALVGLGMLGPFEGTLAGWAALAGLLSMALPAARLGRQSGIPTWPAPLVPFGVLVIVYAVVRSMVLALARGGVRWRETFYDLATLRRARRAG
jgi:GT2 family glycosyltransferase